MVGSTLPENITKFHNNPIVKLFWIIGGLNVIITLGKITFTFDIPTYFLYTSIFISISFLLYMLGINIFRLIHIIKVLKSDKLDIRNSPLVRIVSLTARVLFCAKRFMRCSWRWRSFNWIWFISWCRTCKYRIGTQILSVFRWNVKNYST